LKPLEKIIEAFDCMVWKTTLRQSGRDELGQPLYEKAVDWHIESRSPRKETGIGASVREAAEDLLKKLEIPIY
jgi:hypothetical protein